MPDIAFVNDAFTLLAEARVSVEDRGFQFGDGVYELVRIYGGVPFRLDDHLARLDRSARALSIPLPFDKSRWKALIAEGVKQSGYRDAKVYIQVTRGAAPRDHVFSASLVPTVVITVRPFNALPSALYADGAAVVTVPDIRWGRCDIKSICLLANVLAKQQAHEAGAFEAVFIREGMVLEGSTSNIVAVRGRALLSPPESSLLLSGITRMVTFGLAGEAGILVTERALSDSELYSADEAFLTSTTIEILPIARVNNRAIGGGKPGALTMELMARFRKLHA